MNDVENARAAKEARDAVGARGGASPSFAELAERGMNRYFAAQAYENRKKESPSEVDEEEEKS